MVGGDVNTVDIDASAQSSRTICRPPLRHHRRAGIEALVAAASEHSGGVHVVFNVARAPAGMIVDLHDDEWNFTVDLCS